MTLWKLLLKAVYEIFSRFTTSRPLSCSYFSLFLLLTPPHTFLLKVLKTHFYDHQPGWCRGYKVWRALFTQSEMSREINSIQCVWEESQLCMMTMWLSFSIIYKSGSTVDYGMSRNELEWENSLLRLIFLGEKRLLKFCFLIDISKHPISKSKILFREPKILFRVS